MKVLKFKVKIKWVIVMLIIGIISTLPLISLYQFGFDAKQVEKHINIIAKEKHPLGSEANKKVKEYLVDYLTSLDYEVEVTEIPVKKYTNNILIDNVVLKIPGKNPGQGIALCGHYDSVSSSYGANDDGSAIAAMLEVARLIKDDEFDNDIYFFFTNGEERGLLGSRALEANGYFDGIEYVLNFEARGASGASLMFNTSDMNYNQVKAMSKINLFMRGNSIMSYASKKMPNYTDFMVFKEAGIKGFDFSYIGKGQYYHTKNDSIENLNMMGIRQHAYYMYNSLHYFGKRDNKDLKSNENAIYFSYLNYMIVLKYFQVVVILIGLLLGVVLLAYRKYNGFRSFLDWIKSIILNIGCILSVAFLFYIADDGFKKIVKMFRREDGMVLVSRAPSSQVHSSIIHFVLVIAVSLVITYILKMLLKKWIKCYDSIFAMSVILSIISLILVIMMPELSFLGVFYALPIVFGQYFTKSRFMKTVPAILAVPLLWPVLLTVYQAFGHVTWPAIAGAVASWVLCSE